MFICSELAALAATRPPVSCPSRISSRCEFAFSQFNEDVIFPLLMVGRDDHVIGFSFLNQ